MPASSQNILAFHGFFGTGKDWELLQREFVSREWKANWQCPDLPGHGVNYDERPESIESWLAELDSKVLSASIVIGYSMGGRWAIEYALCFPKKVIALALIGVHMEVQDLVQSSERTLLDAVRAKMLLKEGTAVFWENWKTNPLIASQQKHMDPFDFAELEDRRKMQNPQGLAFALTAYGQGVWPDRLTQLSKIKCPVLVLAGQEDPVGESVRKMQNHFEKSTFSTVQKAGHAPALENPSGLTDILIDFLRK